MRCRYKKCYPICRSCMFSCFHEKELKAISGQPIFEQFKIFNLYYLNEFAQNRENWFHFKENCKGYSSHNFRCHSWWRYDSIYFRKLGLNSGANHLIKALFHLNQIVHSCWSKKICYLKSQLSRYYQILRSNLFPIVFSKLQRKHFYKKRSSKQSTHTS